MDIKRIQEIWDYELITAWDEKGYNRMGSVLTKFLQRVNPKITEKKDGVFLCGISEINEYMVSLNLKRCLDFYIIKGEKHYCFRAFKSDVIGFIHTRCKSMSNALIGGEDKLIVLMSINNYKWTKVNSFASRKFRYEQKKAENAEQKRIKIHARGLSNTNWNTVS